MKITPTERDILEEAAEDWIDALYFYGPYLRYPLSVQHHAALGLAVTMLDGGLLVPGDVAGSQFNPWPGTVAGGIQRIISAWPRGDEPTPGLGAIAWFDLSDAK